MLTGMRAWVYGMYIYIRRVYCLWYKIMYMRVLGMGAHCGEHVHVCILI